MKAEICTNMPGTVATVAALDSTQQLLNALWASKLSNCLQGRMKKVETPTSPESQQ